MALSNSQANVSDSPEEQDYLFNIYDSYKKLCRNENQISEQVKTQLKCRYVSKGNPFLLLAPLKEEEAHLDPLIVIYHDVISDEEIAVLKRLSTPKFKRSTVYNSNTGKLETSQYRIGKSTWFEDNIDSHIAVLNRRVEDLTGLTMSTAEPLQVVNYGIGGHLQPHFDFATEDQVKGISVLGTGNRIATALFYMSDVEQGGATVFTELNVTLAPKKGTAAFWYNLHSNGTGDIRTMHASCPVLVGSKWICNKWIHEYGQEFRRPCSASSR